MFWLMRWQGGDGFRDCARNDEVWAQRADARNGEVGSCGYSGNDGRGQSDGTRVGRRGHRHPSYAVIRTRTHRHPSYAVIRTRTHRHPSYAVILREVAVSMVECRGLWMFWLMRWQGEMDSATAHGMAKFGRKGLIESHTP